MALHHGLVSMNEVTDTHHVVLDQDPGSGRWYLGSMLSLELNKLPPGEFELFFVEEKGFYFPNGGC